MEALFGGPPHASPLLAARRELVATGWFHSHSIIPSHARPLISRCKLFRRTTKNRLPGLSKTSVLQFKWKFRRFKICLVHVTIGIDRSIFVILAPNRAMGLAEQKTVSVPARRRSAPPSNSMALRHFPQDKQA
jgi:hypothetical protein